MIMFEFTESDKKKFDENIIKTYLIDKTEHC